MRELLHSLFIFIKGTIHYRLLHKGAGAFSRPASIVPINSYRFAALPGRRRYGMNKKLSPGKVVTLAPVYRSASSN